MRARSGHLTLGPRTGAHRLDRFGAALERVTAGTPPAVAVLAYRRVGRPRPDLDPAHLSATPEQFEAQLRYLTSTHRVVAVEALPTVRDGTAPDRAAAVTFDHPYREFAEVAWPVIRRMGVPVTLFVPTAFPDRPEQGFWWEHLYRSISTTTRPYVDVPFGRLPVTSAPERAYACRVISGYAHKARDDRATELVADVMAQLGAVPAAAEVLSWSELRELAADGLHVAPRSRTHRPLDGLSPVQIRTEVAASRNDVERELGCRPAVCAYSGAATPEVLEALRGEGYQVAFGTGTGLDDLRFADPLSLRRIPVHAHRSLLQFRTGLHPAFANRRPSRYQPTDPGL